MSKFSDRYEKLMSESMGAKDYYLKNLKNSILFLVGQMEFSGSLDEFKQHIKSEFGLRGLELFTDEQLENMRTRGQDQD